MVYSVILFSNRGMGLNECSVLCLAVFLCLWGFSLRFVSIVFWVRFCWVGFAWWTGCARYFFVSGVYCLRLLVIINAGSFLVGGYFGCS